MSRPKENRNMVQLNFRIDPENADQLRQMAEKQGRSLSNLIAWLLSQAVNSKQGKGE